MNIRDEDEYIFFYRVVYSGYIDVVRELVVKGVDVYVVIVDGWILLYSVCKWNNIKVVFFLF